MLPRETTTHDAQGTPKCTTIRLHPRSITVNRSLKDKQKPRTEPTYFCNMLERHFGRLFVLTVSVCMHVLKTCDISSDIFIIRYIYHAFYGCKKIYIYIHLCIHRSTGQIFSGPPNETNPKQISYKRIPFFA